MEHIKYHTVRTILKIQHCQNNSNIQSKIVETETKSKHRSFSWIGRVTSIEKYWVLTRFMGLSLYLRLKNGGGGGGGGRGVGDIPK